MIQQLNGFFLNFNLDNETSALLTYFSVLIGLIIVGTILYFFLHKLCHTFLLNKLTAKYKQQHLKHLLLENKLIRIVLLFFPPAFIYYFLPVLRSSVPLGSYAWLIELTDKILVTYMLVLFAILINKVIDMGEAIYNQYPISKKWPIKSYTQFLKIFSFIIFTIVIIASLVDKSPLAFFTGLGAMMAIIMLVFKDSILSFVSSIQLSASNMVQVGQWIEIPGKDISGTIIEMSLNTVKIQNFDKTISTVPPYFLTSNILKNWQGMYDAGGRRFKRAIPFDMNSVRPADEIMLEELEKISLLKEYINKHRDTLLKTGSNLQLFRNYAQALVDQDARIHKENFTCLVRELAPSSINGVSVEVYAFTVSVNWKDHEVVAADIMDNLIAHTPHFGLKLLQQT